MIGLHRVIVWWLALSAWACGALAQTAPGDSLHSPAAPAESVAVIPDTLAAGAVPDMPVPGMILSGPRTLTFGNQAVATGREILEVASFSIGEAFAASPGVHPLLQGWHGLPQHLSIRGARVGEVVCLLEGVPFSDNQIEALDLTWLPLAGMEKVEVVKGGLSSIRGSAAIGGVLEITPVTAMPDFPGSEITAWWGSYDGRAVSLRFNRRITHRLGILGTYENLGSGGWTDNSSSEIDKFSGKVTALLGETTQFDLAGYTYKGDFEWPDSCPAFSRTSPGDQGNDRDFLKASVFSGEDRRFHIHYYRLGTSESYSSADTGYIHDGTLNGVDLGMSWLAADSAMTSLGAGYKSRRIESSSLGNRTSNDLYAYALKELRSDRWRVQGSIRLAKNSGFDAEAGLGLAGRFAPRRGVYMFARLDRSYLFPTFHVLYHRGKDEPADAAIQTETSKGLEIGSALEKGPAEVSLSVFGRDTDGLAMRRTDDSCGTYLEPCAEIDVVGFEASLAVSLRPWLDASVSYSICCVEGRTGERPAYPPEEVITFGTGLSKTLSKHVSVGITLAGRYVGPVEIGARLVPCESGPSCVQDAELPEYISGMLNAHVDIDRAVVFFKIQNLANNEIRTGWGRPPLPSRSYEFGVSALLVD